MTRSSSNGGGSFRLRFDDGGDIAERAGAGLQGHVGAAGGAADRTLLKAERGSCDAWGSQTSSQLLLGVGKPASR